MGYTSHSYRRHARERGDTIVEVLLSLAVLGAVLGSAYVVTNRSMIVNRMAQERLDGVKLAEAQFERLKVESFKEGTTLHSADDFCLPKNPTIDGSNGQVQALAAQSDPRCKVDANGESVGADFQPRYTIAISNEGTVDLPDKPDAGTRFKVTVTWDNVAGDGTDRIDQFYEVYR
jgi:hypothetical protein